jgi:hypothetical protein
VPQNLLDHVSLQFVVGPNCGASSPRRRRGGDRDCPEHVAYIEFVGVADALPDMPWFLKLLLHRSNYGLPSYATQGKMIQY